MRIIILVLLLSFCSCNKKQIPEKAFLGDGYSINIYVSPTDNIRRHSLDTILYPPKPKLRFIGISIKWDTSRKASNYENILMDKILKPISNNFFCQD